MISKEITVEYLSQQVLGLQKASNFVRKSLEETKSELVKKILEEQPSNDEILGVVQNIPASEWQRLGNNNHPVFSTNYFRPLRIESGFEKEYHYLTISTEGISPIYLAGDQPEEIYLRLLEKAYLNQNGISSR